jgi:transposase
VNRIKGVLAAQGLAVKVDDNLRDRLTSLRLWDGQPLPTYLVARVQRELDRIDLVDQQICEIKQERSEHQQKSEDAQARQVRQLCALRGIGPESAWLTVGELFSWRNIRNRKQLAALAGLTPTPYDSGTVQKEQGISKAGNKRVRSIMVQIAWGWLQNQPNSALTQWYQRRFGSGSKRQRRIGIVAMARKLLIKLWQYLETGAVPEGAAFST